MLSWTWLSLASLVHFCRLPSLACQALAAGCTIVCKPAEDTPLTALALAALGEQAGVPAGVFNVIPSSRAHSITNGTELCENETVRKVCTRLLKIVAVVACSNVQGVAQIPVFPPPLFLFF